VTRSRSITVSVVGALALVALSTASVVGQSPTSGTSAPSDADATQPWIAYYAGTGGTRLVHPDGTDDHPIASDFRGQLVLADWTPDGGSLVATSRETGGAEPLYRYDLATGSYAPLFACAYPCLTDDEPNVSPDGTKVAFSRAVGPFDGVAPADCGIWVGDIATGEVSQLTSNARCDREYFPRWSPDGSQLVYWRWREDGDETTGLAIFVMDADGSNVRQVTDWEDMAAEPDWSPDGQWLVFAVNAKGAGTANVYRMHPDGTGAEQLTFASGDDNAAQPRYTPDGTSILFTAWRPGLVTTSVMSADGGEPTVIVEDSTHGTWQRGR
jgi:Tol biopolymer transport system component